MKKKMDWTRFGGMLEHPETDRSGNMNRDPGLAAMSAVAAAVGFLVLVATLPMDFVTGASDYWRSPSKEGIDAIAALSGLRFFLADIWRWPLLDVPGFGPGGGINVAYTDSVPLLAIALKAMGVRDVNPYGWWVAASYLLTPVAAVRVARLLGMRSLFAAAALALFAATLPIFQLRVAHATLTAHWMILLGIEIHLRRRAGLPWRGGEAALPAFALGIHPYLFALCMGPPAMAAAADALAAARRRATGTAIAAFAPLAVGCLAAAALAWAIGLRSPPLGDEREWGNYAMNLMSPAWPRFSTIVSFPFDAISDPRQQDGRAWAGFGAIALVAAAFGFLPRPASPLIRRHAPLIVTGVAYLAYAITTRAAFGPWLLLDWYPEFLAPALEAFRASGRFAWLPAWLAVVGAAALLGRSRGGIALLVLLAAAQLVDTIPVRREAARIVENVRPSGVERDIALRAFSSARRIELHPPYDCVASSDMHDAALDIVAMASETRTPIDSARTARRTADCRAAAARAESPDQPEGTLRLFLGGGADAMALPPQPAWTARCPEVPAGQGGTMRACGDAWPAAAGTQPVDSLAESLGGR